VILDPVTLTMAAVKKLILILPFYTMHTMAMPRNTRHYSHSFPSTDYCLLIFQHRFQNG
jgi:hypothetical protein